MLKKQTPFIITVFSVITGCALYSPSYEKPDVDSPPVTRNGMIIESSNTDLSQISWWKKMNDLVLDDLINKALANNNQIQIAQGNVLQAQAKLSSAQFSWIPTLNAGALGFAGNSFDTNTTSNNSNLPIQSGSQNNANFNGYGAGFMPGYTFNIFTNISRTKLAKASLETQRAAVGATRLSVIGQVSGSYFMLLGQKNQLRLQKQMIKDMEDLESVLNVQLQDGATDASSIIGLRQLIAQTKSKIPSIENSISQTENALQLLINQNPGPIITNGDINKLNIAGIIPANLPSTVLKNRPDIIMAEGQLKQANANIALANSVFFPTISLTGLTGGGSLALSNLFNSSGGFWAGQASAFMPILNAQSFEQVKAAKGGYYVSYYNYVQTVKSAFSNVDNSLTNQQKINDAYADMVKSCSSAQDLYQLSLVKSKYGATDNRNVLGSKLNVDTAELTLNNIKMQQLDSIVQVYQALAGGYNVESELSAPKSIKGLD